MAASRATPAFIEIVERVPDTGDVSDAETNTGGYIKPNEVRINGIPLAIPRGQRITVHEIVMNDGERADDVVQVTLTLFARRVVIGAEPTDPDTD